MSAGRASDVLARHAQGGKKIGARTFLPPAGLRRLIAASTEAQLAIRRLHAAEGDRVAPRELAPVDLTGTTSWEAVVFRANAAALSMLDRLVASGGEVLLAADLVDRAGFWSERAGSPAAEATDDELAWRVESLDASLAAAAAMGVGVPDVEHERLQALRDELARR